MRHKVICLLQRSLQDEDENLACLQRAKIIVSAYLDNNQRDVDALCILALLLETPPLADELQSIEVVKKILVYEPTNYKALLMLAVFEENLGRISLSTFKKLCDFKGDDNDILAMIEYEKSRYFFHDDNLKKQYEDALRKSVRLSKKFAWNYIRLGEFLIQSGFISEGCDYINQGLKNVVQPPEPYSAGSFIDVDRFISEFVTGTQMSQSNYEAIQQTLMFNGF